VIDFIKDELLIPRISADTHHRSPNFGKLFAEISEAAALFGSTRGHGLRKKEQDHGSRQQQIKKPDGVSELIDGLKVGSEFTYPHGRILGR